MNKHQLYRHWQWFRVIKPRYILAAALLSAIVCVFALRANNQHMAELRSQLFTADKENKDVQGALERLQSYVTAHMNTDLSTGGTSVYPPIQLQYTYERAAGQTTDNDALYTQAQAYCQQQNSTDFSGRNRVPCIEQYVKDHGAQPKEVADSLFKFDFVSPKWSPDLAGWSLLTAFVFTFLGIVKFIFDFVNRHKRST